MLKFKSIIFIAAIALLSGCNEDKSSPAAQQSAQQQTQRPVDEPGIHGMVQARVEEVMAGWDQECSAQGLSGSQQCWLNKSQSMTYQYMQDFSAYRNMKKQLDPQFVEYMEAYNAKNGPLSDCYAAAKQNVRMRVFCSATQLVHLNMAIQQYQRGTWKYPPANEDFVGD